jgi:hypothetical protein
VALNRGPSSSFIYLALRDASWSKRWDKSHNSGQPGEIHLVTRRAQLVQEGVDGGGALRHWDVCDQPADQRVRRAHEAEHPGRLAMPPNTEDNFMPPCILCIDNH